MKKDYVISKIEASQDDAFYVYIALSDPNEAGRRKVAKFFWFEHYGLYVTGRSDEKFAKSDGKYIQVHGRRRPGFLRPPVVILTLANQGIQKPLIHPKS